MSSRSERGFFLTAAKDFTAAEDGAVTADWVMLTSGLVGMGLAVMTVVASGVEDLSFEISTQLTGMEIGMDLNPLFEALTVFTGGFDDGADGFVGGDADSVAGFGDVLVIDQGDMAELSVDIPPGASSATLEFDLIAADDFDGDTATIFINGQEVAFYSDSDGNISVSDAGVSGISVSVEQQYTNENRGGGGLDDSRATYTITVDDPGTNLTFGVSSDASATRENEFFALDDVTVTAQ